MANEIKHIPNELVDTAGILVSKLYLTYYEVNETIIPIQQLNGKYVDIENNKDYEVPLICSVILQILIESVNKEKFANLILQTFKLGIDSGMTEYEAMLNVIGAYKLVWGNHLPKIELKDNVEIYTGGLLSKLKEEGNEVIEPDAGN